MIEFRVLGPLQVVAEGRALPLGGLKQRGLLAMLLIERNRVVPRESLIDALWGDEPPASAANSVQVYVSRLRRLLDDADPTRGVELASEPPGYVLHPRPGSVDADEFERLLGTGKALLAGGELADAEAALAAALALWRGPALADLAAEPYAQPEIARLEGLRLETLETRFDAMLAVGRQAEAVGELQALVGLHPLDERLRAQLMRALYRSGRQAEALDAYRAFRRLLSDELGLEPCVELRELEHAMLQQDAALQPERTAGSVIHATSSTAVAPSRVTNRAVADLCAGLAGTHALAEALEPDEAKALVAECRTAIGRAVDEYGGAVRTFGEEQVCGRFGAPTPHEDDVERAMRAAIRILQVVESYSRDIEAAWGISGFGVRVGVDTAGPELGEAESGARRLQTAAAAGSVLAGEEAVRRVADRFVFEPLRSIETEGADEPVVSSRLLRAREVEGSSGPRPIVGRDDEIGRLREIVQDLRVGRGHIVLLIGEPGIGKTRLLTELRSLAGDGVSWLEGACHSYGGFPCWALAECVLHWLGADIDEPAIVLRTKARARLGVVVQTELESVLAPLATLLRLRFEPPVVATREEIERAYVHWIEALSADRPVILAVEDAHWADRPTRQLAEALLELTDRAPVVLAFTQEPIAGSEGAALRARALTDYGHRTTELDLGPLTDAAADELLEIAIGEAIDEATRTRLIREAEGNPFYLEELGRAYLEGALDPQGHTWTLTMGARELLPPTLENLLVARIDRLPDGPRRLAQIAAAVGRTFPARVLERVAGETIEAPLTALLRALIVREVRRYPELECAFTHGLLREAVLSTIPAARSRSLHAEIAAAYESLYADSLDEHLERLAHYHAQAGNLPRALEYAERARAGAA